MRVDEIGEVSALLRQTITTYPPLTSDLSVDFLLYTADGDFLPLEAWHLSIREEAEGDQENQEVQAQGGAAQGGLGMRGTNVRTQLYHQMGVLLKSAMAVARVTPMFRYYVRHQSADTFIVFYRVYEGHPELDLGEGQKLYSIGKLESPFGTISLELGYRTKMQIERSLKHQRSDIMKTSSIKRIGSLNNQLVIGEAKELDERMIQIPFLPSTSCVCSSPSRERFSEENDGVSQCDDTFSTFSVSPASQKSGGFSRTGSTSSTFSYRFDRSASSTSDDGSMKNVFGGLGSSPRISETLARGIPSQPNREKQPPRTSSLPFFALLTASTSNVIFRSQPLDKVPENEAMDNTMIKASAEKKETATAMSCSYPSSSSQQTTPTSETLRSASDYQRNAVDSSLLDSAEVETIRASTVSTVMAASYKYHVAEGDSNTDDDDDSSTQAATTNADISSDDSFVKVPFGSWHDGDGSDLGDAVHLFRLASQQTAIGFAIDQPDSINYQLAKFEAQQSVFDRFLADLVRVEERESNSLCLSYQQPSCASPARNKAQFF
ncbi:unnamed protein product [Anisakis simplex]|uniref:Uncharacterized protein n=1 Tax=Anisakis simplex TaxID=6269 RepID=A0A3P6QLT3_ANISI|nr:unnamed protein product [Anisakis simplex]